MSPKTRVKVWMGSSNEPRRSARRESKPAIRRLPSDRSNRRSKNHLYWLRGPVSCRGPVVAGPGALRGGRSWWSGKSQASRGRESRVSQLCLNPGADHRRASRHCEQPLHSVMLRCTPLHSSPRRRGKARAHDTGARKHWLPCAPGAVTSWSSEPMSTSHVSLSMDFARVQPSCANYRRILVTKIW